MTPCSAVKFTDSWRKLVLPLYVCETSAVFCQIHVPESCSLQNYQVYFTALILFSFTPTCYWIVFTVAS